MESRPEGAEEETGASTAAVRSHYEEVEHGPLFCQHPRRQQQHQQQPQQQHQVLQHVPLSQQQQLQPQQLEHHQKLYSPHYLHPQQLQVQHQQQRQPLQLPHSQQQRPQPQQHTLQQPVQPTQQHVHAQQPHQSQQQHQSLQRQRSLQEPRPPHRQHVHEQHSVNQHLPQQQFLPQYTQGGRTAQQYAPHQGNRQQHHPPQPPMPQQPSVLQQPQAQQPFAQKQQQRSLQPHMQHLYESQQLSHKPVQPLFPQRIQRTEQHYSPQAMRQQPPARHQPHALPQYMHQQPREHHHMRQQRPREQRQHPPQQQPHQQQHSPHDQQQQHQHPPQQQHQHLPQQQHQHPPQHQQQHLQHLQQCSAQQLNIPGGQQHLHQPQQQHHPPQQQHAGERLLHHQQVQLREQHALQQRKAHQEEQQESQQRCEQQDQPPHSGELQKLQERRYLRPLYEHSPAAAILKGESRARESNEEVFSAAAQGSAWSAYEDGSCATGAPQGTASPTYSAVDVCGNPATAAFAQEAANAFSDLAPMVSKESTAAVDVHLLKPSALSADRAAEVPTLAIYAGSVTEDQPPAAVSTSSAVCYAKAAESGALGHGVERTAHTVAGGATHHEESSDAVYLASHVAGFPAASHAEAGDAPAADAERAVAAVQSSTSCSHTSVGGEACASPAEAISLPSCAPRTADDRMSTDDTRATGRMKESDAHGVEKAPKTVPLAASVPLPTELKHAGEVGDGDKLGGTAPTAAREKVYSGLLDVEEAVEAPATAVEATSHSEDTVEALGAAAAGLCTAVERAAKDTAPAAAGVSPAVARHSEDVLQTLVRLPAAERRQREERLLQPLSKQQRRQLTARLSASARALQRWVDGMRSKGDSDPAAAAGADAQDPSDTATACAEALEGLRETLLLLPPASLFAGLEPLDACSGVASCSDSRSANAAAVLKEDEDGDVHFHATPAQTAAAADSKVSADSLSSAREPPWFSQAEARSRDRFLDTATAAAADLRYQVAEDYLPDVSAEEDTLLDEIFPFGPADPYSVLYTDNFDGEKAKDVLASLTSCRPGSQSKKGGGDPVSACSPRRSSSPRTSGSSSTAAMTISNGSSLAVSNIPVQQRHKRGNTSADLELHRFEEASYPQTAFPLSSQAAIVVWDALQAEKKWLPWLLPPGLDKPHAAAWVRGRLRLQRRAAREWRSLRLWTLEHTAAAAPFTADLAFAVAADTRMKSPFGALPTAASAGPSAFAGPPEEDRPPRDVRSGERETNGTAFTSALKAELEWLRHERLQTWRRSKKKRRGLEGLVLEENKKQQIATQQRLLREVLTAKRRRQGSLFFVVA